MFQNPSQTQLTNILQRSKTIAVVGLSDNRERTSYRIAEQLQRRGYRIIPVNPHVTQVLGEPSYAAITDVRERIDIVNVFRRSDALIDVVREVVQTDAPVIWAQQGVYDEDASRLAHDHDRTIIMDLCIAVTHSLLVRARRVSE